MTFNEQQHAIIRRMSEISARLDAAMEADHAAHTAMGNNLLNISAELVATIRRANEIGILQREYGNAFREFLDTL
jgi:hypothetical protein